MLPSDEDKISEYLSQPLPTETIVIELPDLPGAREWIEEFAHEHIGKVVYATERNSLRDVLLLAGMSCVLTEKTWRITATMVKPPANVKIHLSVVPLTDVLRPEFTRVLFSPRKKAS